MKRSLRIAVLTLLAMAMLTVTALADMGPKPQLTIRVDHAPEELYYLDILAEGSYADDENPFDGLKWSYSDEEIAALDQELLEALEVLQGVQEKANEADYAASDADDAVNRRQEAQEAVTKAEAEKAAAEERLAAA